MRSTSGLSGNAVRVLEARYLRRDAAGRVIETPGQLFGRVAQAVSRAEAAFGGGASEARWADEFHAVLSRLDFLPNSPALMNAGTPVGQLSACFVLPVEDSLEDIFRALGQMALIQRSGGGTGFSFSGLRPRGHVLESSGGEASGPVSFLRVFDCATENVRLGGRRRGANMAVLRVDHPDVLEFVAAKLEEGALRNFNLSVSVTDAFMDAVRRDDRFDLVHPTRRARAGRLKARAVFQAIVDAAWRTGEPGLLFHDAVNRANPTPHLGPIEATNPCGEVPLLPHESCNLGSINLAHVLARHGSGVEVDWRRLGALTRTAIRLLDDMIEVNRYPIPEVAHATARTRKTGLGVMGFAEMLIRLGVPYQSSQAVRLAERVMRTIRDAARRQSEELAVERGPFPAWSEAARAPRGRGVRNATRTAIAPTGTISIIGGTSPSIEPLFALAYRRANVLDGRTLEEVNPLLIGYLEDHHPDPGAALADVLARGRLEGVGGISPAARRLFRTALDIPVEQHLRIQAAFQRFVDNSVSKTINLPADAAPEDVRQAYWRAWELGLKGITVYRYGSRRTQVLELGAREAPHHYEHTSPCDPMECRV